MTQPPRCCPGPLAQRLPNRRCFMQFGLAGAGGLSLPGLLRLRAMDGQSATSQSNSSRSGKSIIMVWQPGGCSHIDTYDPKPNASSEYRGPFGQIATKLPGYQFTELIPRQAAIADKMVVLRSMYQYAPGHPAGSMQLLSGDPDTRDKPAPKYPDWMSVSHYLLSRKAGAERSLPGYVGINPPTEYNGPAYLGDAYSPFSITGDPSAPSFVVPNIGLSDASEVGRIQRRVSLRQQLDTLDRAFDRSGELGALDQFESQALSLLTDAQTKRAFDLTMEDDATRDRYGRNSWGQQLLMARRLAEAGVDIITTSLSGKLCGRVHNWDDHAVNHNVFEALRFRAEVYDQAVTALIEDIYQRGLDENILVVVTGEFGRTPRISYDASTGAGDGSAPAGTKQPGRDHWVRGFSNVWAGGGIRVGQVVGATDRLGEDAIERRCGPGDFLATLYHHLGIDSSKVFLEDFNGRPTPIVDRGRPIQELI
ncbi:MAG: DUF1501 domain-containing protein [Pirellulaceae bacterium]|nr:DUF1501 domain-containing protein [Pirellulaceae bacterium]